VLTDFGIARILGGTQYTASGAVIGTPAYLSPEQGKGERGDVRSDVYALGVVLFEMATGRVPFDADTPLAVIFQHISAPLPPPRSVKNDIPVGVEAVILKTLAKEPDDRFPSVAAMANALEEALAVGAGREPAPASEEAEPQTSFVMSSESVIWPAAPESPGEQAERPEPLEKAQGSRDVRLPARGWRGLGLALFLIALTWGACGLLFGAVPLEESDRLPNPESTNFWITRGCFLGPAFALAFLSYLAVLAGRRPDGAVRCSELAVALGAALGLIPILWGFAVMVQPAAAADDRIFAPLLCILPGMFVLAVTGIFWALVVRTGRRARGDVS
jgi:hypothetical protein